MKVIFLDIDGVLNSDLYDKTNTGKYIPYMSEIDPHAVMIFKLALDSDTKIVVSSSWRETLPLEKLQEYIDLPLSDMTDACMPKAQSIEKYVREHNLKHFAVVDDEYLFDLTSPFHKHFVKTMHYAGFIRDHVDQVKETLKLEFT